MTSPGPFDLLGPLPGPGTTMLEASAGTGKTFTIASLVTRYVAEGVPIERILAVTFTRMATAELRGRVRDRLVSAQEGLAVLLDTGAQPDGGDRLLRHLAQGSPQDVSARCARLTSALANFDAATITTTHGFCHLVLAGLGIAGAVAPGSVLTDDPGDATTQVVEDLYVRWVLRNGRPFSLRHARTVVDASLANPDTIIPDADEGADTEIDVRLARAARAEIGNRLVEAGLLTYDDLLVRLKHSLKDPDRGELACSLLRDSYSVVLVDEFQDTDPIQWDVVNVAFGSGATTLVVIGDPKQAIYSFRGGDVHCYLDATASAGSRFTLAENWRSDAGLLAAYDALMDPLHLGHPDIPYRKVDTPPEHRERGVAGLPAGAALRIRVVGDRGYPTLKRTKTGGYAKGSAEEWIAADLASDVVKVLRSGATLIRPPHAGEPLGPGHIAVLVRTNRQASHVESALVGAGVPAVMGSTASVFATEATRYWLALLEALEQPASRPRVANLALTPLMGRTAREVATMEEERWELLHAQVHGWTDVLRGHGVAALFRAVMTTSSLPERLLSRPDGSRLLTDLGHIAQLLHTETASGAQGPSALRAWLARRHVDASSEGDLEERSRRLDSDADAVQVMTIHRAKGLEFPLVYCPFLWDAARTPRDGEPVVYHDPEVERGHGSSRRVDVTGRGKSPSYEEHRRLAGDEQLGEDLRLLYVALTRARHQAVLWWVGTTDSSRSPLGRLLTRRPGDPGAAAGRRPKQADVMRRLHEIGEASNGNVAPEICDEPSPEIWTPERPEELHLEAAVFDRVLDRSWRRSSYSSMTASRPQDPELVSSEPEEPGTVDEPDDTVVEPGASGAEADTRLAGVVCPLSDAPGGTEFGTFVHSVLERVDFAASDLDSELRAAAAAVMSRRPSDVGVLDDLVGGLAAAIRTPLGPLPGGISLHDIAVVDRLDELTFELPLAGGDDPTGSIDTASIAALLDRHLGPPGPLRGYAARLLAPGMQSDLRGYLTGSLDMVFRTQKAGGPGAGTGNERYFVVDYKTNRLGRSGETLTAWHYRPEALDAEMQQAHYPLQALLYSVALHRYLRWRVAGYDPDVHLGGVLYLFVRGMTGPDCPEVDGQPCGVFSWAPSSELVSGLSDLLDAGAVALPLVGAAT